MVVNVLNASVALYFSYRAVQAEIQLVRTRHRQREATAHLNHHLRNALSIVQDAVFLTNDEQTMNFATMLWRELSLHW
jgi:PAS domain-containing protein